MDFFFTYLYTMMAMKAKIATSTTVEDSTTSATRGDLVKTTEKKIIAGLLMNIRTNECVLISIFSR